MKPSTHKGFCIKIRNDLRSSGLYRPEFEEVISRLAELYMRMREIRMLNKEKELEPVIELENKNGSVYYAKNPYLQELDSLQKSALDLERDMGLTPAALKKINEAAMTVKADEDPLSAALSRLRVVS